MLQKLHVVLLQQLPKTGHLNKRRYGLKQLKVITVRSQLIVVLTLTILRN